MLRRPWWLTLALPLAACEGSPPAATSSSGSSGHAEAPVTPSAASASAPPVRSDAVPADAGGNSAGGPEVGTAELASDVKSANAFTFKILARTKKPTENALVSGTSLRQALGAAFLGARGATAREMAAALALDENTNVTARLAHAELDAWDRARGNAELNVANRLWVGREFPLQPDFVSAADHAFGAAPATVDYGKPEDARKTINAWVSEKTKEKIAELLPQGSIDKRTRLVITNAIWFKGAWQLPFPKSATKDEPFKLDAAKTVSAPMMHLTDSFRVATLPGLKVLELRYTGSALAMLVVLPDDPGGLAKITVGADALDGWTSALATARVNVTLPRFAFRSGGVMNGTLADLGMKTAFTDRADFGGISASPEHLSVSDVFHQTWISVDELGTEAAAATGTVMRTTSLVGGPVVEFKADHPFVFLIEDTTTGRLLFAGRVATPK